MTSIWVETREMIEAVQRIPCELTTLTYDAERLGSAWLGCKECARCLLLIYLQSDSLHILGMLLAKPLNGGYQLRVDLRTSEIKRETK